MARNVKQVIVFRKDLLKGDTSIRKGKFAAQVAHASVGALMQTTWKNKFPSVNPETPDKMIHNWHFLFADTDESPLNLWLNGTFTKIVLSIDEADVVEKDKDGKPKTVHYTADEMLVKLYNKIKAENSNIPVTLITDCGLTEFHGVATNTCVGIGPWWSDEIDEFTKDLKLL